MTKKISLFNKVNLLNGSYVTLNNGIPTITCTCGKKHPIDLSEKDRKSLLDNNNEIETIEVKTKDLNIGDIIIVDCNTNSHNYPLSIPLIYCGNSTALFEKNNLLTYGNTLPNDVLKIEKLNEDVLQKFPNIIKNMIKNIQDL